MYFEEGDIEEEQYVRPPNPTLEFILSPDEPIKCKTLCIGFYGISSLFVCTLFKADKPTATINFQRAKQRSLASVYVDENGTAFLVFNENFEAMKEIHLSKFIEQKFVCQNVILFSSRAKGLLENSQVSNCQYISSSFWNQCHGNRYNEGFSGPQADLIAWSELNRKPLMCLIGIFSDYEINREIIDNIFGNLNGKYGLQCKNEISGLIKKYNMTKYGNKLYL